MKIIVCDKCFTIPKIRIINRNEIKLDVKIEKKIMPNGFNYFNKFINGNNYDDLFYLNAILIEIIQGQFYIVLNAINIYVVNVLISIMKHFKEKGI